MQRLQFLLAALACTSVSAWAEQPHRHLGAHEHGHGRMNIAIEDKTLSMELEVPGADIVGFEHEPTTPEQKSALEKAKAKLADGLSLFIPTPAAGCSLKSAKVSTEAEHEDEHEHDQQATRQKPGEEKEEAEHHHSEFHVEYALECTSIARLTSMTFDYFKAFAGAQELDVALISPKGQTSYEVKRDRPSLDLTGIM